MPRSRQSIPTASPDDAFLQAMQILASRPRRERNAVIAFIIWWFGMAAETRAALTCVIRPDMKREDVAALVGVSSRRLGDYPAYRESLPKREDYHHVKRQPSKRRRSARGGWWVLDNPDRSSD